MYPVAGNMYLPQMQLQPTPRKRCFKSLRKSYENSGNFEGKLSPGLTSRIHKAVSKFSSSNY